MRESKVVLVLQNRSARRLQAPMRETFVLKTDLDLANGIEMQFVADVEALPGFALSTSCARSKQH
jgi:hypothetical protein